MLKMTFQKYINYDTQNTTLQHTHHITHTHTVPHYEHTHTTLCAHNRHSKLHRHTRFQNITKFKKNIAVENALLLAIRSFCLHNVSVL